MTASSIFYLGFLPDPEEVTRLEMSSCTTYPRVTAPLLGCLYSPILWTVGWSKSDAGCRGMCDYPSLSFLVGAFLMICVLLEHSKSAFSAQTSTKWEQLSGEAPARSEPSALSLCTVTPGNEKFCLFWTSVSLRIIKLLNHGMIKAGKELWDHQNLPSNQHHYHNSNKDIFHLNSLKNSCSF